LLRSNRARTAVDQRLLGYCFWNIFGRPQTGVPAPPGLFLDNVSAANQSN